MTLRVLSLGGGVQSSALALMADRGDYDLHPPDVAIFANTGWEAPETLAMVAWLAEELSYPVDVVTAGDLRERVGSGYTPIPAHFLGGIGHRQCTRDYKLSPINTRIRELLGVKRIDGAGRVERWLGISYDEHHRMADSRERWATNTYPLVDRRLTRDDCRAWWHANAPAGAPPLVRSACIGCPLHSRAEWADLARRHPDLIEQAARLEDGMNADADPADHRRLHRRRIPLRVAVARDLRQADDDDAQGDLFASECLGLCGT